MTKFTSSFLAQLDVTLASAPYFLHDALNRNAWKHYTEWFAFLARAQF